MGCSSSSSVPSEGQNKRPAERPNTKETRSNKKDEDNVKHSNDKRGRDEGHTNEEAVSVSDVVPTIVKNDAINRDDLPDDDIGPSKEPFTSGHGQGKWPIRNYSALHVSTNSFHGGCAGILQCSNTYGGPGQDTTAEVLLYRAGFTGNHFGCTSIIRGNSGHFGTENGFFTDETGHLIGNLMFGTNHVSLMTNDPSHGDMSHGLALAGDDQDEDLLLPLNVNGSNESGGSGNTLILCTGWESGSGDASLRAGVYMVRSGAKDDFQEAKFICGEDKWTFCVVGEQLSVSGLSKGQYGLYHNRTTNIVRDQVTQDNKAFVGHVRCFKGDEEASLFKTSASSGCFLVMCSNTGGTQEDASCAALYCLTYDSSGELSTKYITGQAGSQHTLKDPNVWKFSESSGVVKVVGPKGPCRYGFISNMSAKRSELVEDTMKLCLATGQPDALVGRVVINKEVVKGWMSKKCDVLISVNKSQELQIPAAELADVGRNRWGFCHKWTPEEKRPGLKLVQVTGQDLHIDTKLPVSVELTGSPRRVVHNYPGVIYSLNCGGSDYQSEEGIIYEAEFSRFASYTYDYNFGSESLAGGCIKHVTEIPQLIAGTVDGHMFARHRTPYIEAVDEKYIEYQIEGLPNGKHKLRLHMVHQNCGDLKINGEAASKKVDPQFNKIADLIPGRTAHTAEVEITIKQNSLELSGRTCCICSFAVLGKEFKPKQKSPDQINQEKVMSQKLMDTISPLTRTMARKERKLVGWSPNLLKNASAEMNNLDGWDIRGDIKVHEGGYGTERSFVTSHMWCTKKQTVDLSRHCSTEHLDSGPPIQVMEWYREGVCGGGHYYFRAALLDAHGQTIKEHVLPETGRLYKNNEWMCEEVTFKDYMPGVRLVQLETRGKDDKHWGGHYGVIMSAAEIRIQRETDAAENDIFAEIMDLNDTSVEKETQLVREREDLILRLLRDNASLLKDQESEKAVSGGNPGHLAKVGEMKRPKQRKKREVRVFVSSTFRDFTQEREELIKKTFREINKMCVDRGVCFTYVDLRWGINEEQTQHGETIAICLREIDRCRPYFVCMMGERYGWCQKEGTSDPLLDGSFTYAAENFPKQLGWVDKYRLNTSVTKLEILHGVLNDVQNCKDRSFFYIRDPVKEGDVPQNLYPRMQPESEWHKERQYSLRNEISQRKELNVRQYGRHLEACDKIKTDLEMCIDEDFPLGTELTALEREREAHIAFAEARRRVYIGREDYFKHIDQFMESKANQPFVILGESGSGKSALVANWAGRAEERLKNAFIFVHFIGSSAESSSYLKLLRRLYEEMREFYGFELSVPQSDQNLVQDLPTWLKLAGSVKEVPCVIVLDALNQLQAESGGEGAEHDLLWIPRLIPPGVSMLLSTLPGRAYDAVERQGWPTMKVEPLQVKEKMKIVTEYLEGIYGKHLAEKQKALMVDAPQTNNPLYLKALLDEVRMYGSFRTLTQKIEDYLEAGNPPQLFAKILSRLEDDFETSDQSKGLVKKTASAIWCSNKGMTESELLTMLDIPSPVWSPFYLSVVDNLVNKNGVVNFFHDHLRQAVEAKYLSSDEEKKQGYTDLADFFLTLEMNDRVAEELPFVLAKAGDMDRLKTVISKLDLFKRLIKTEEGKFDLIKFWTMLGDFNQVEKAYNEELNNCGDMDSDELEKIEQGLAQFFVDLGLFDEARAMFEQLLEQVEAKYVHKDKMIMYDAHSQSYKTMCKHPAVLDLLNNLGAVCEKRKDFQKACTYYADAVNRQRCLNVPNTKLQLTESLLGQASALTGQDNAKDASLLLVRCQELAKDVLGPRHHYVAAIMNKIGQLAYIQGRVDEALGYYIQDLRLTRADVGTSHPRIANIFNDIALAYDEKNNQLAGKIYEAALYILLSLYGESHLDVACLRYNLGSFYFATNSFARGKYQYTEALKVYEKFLGADHSDTVDTRKALEEISGFAK